MAEVQTIAVEESRTEEILSIQQRRWRKFRSLKRGYYSLLVLLGAYVVSMFLPLLVNNRAVKKRKDKRN